MDVTKMTVFPSQLGWMAAAWTGRRLCELTIGHASPEAAARGLRWTSASYTERLDRVVKQWISRLRDYALGDHQDDFRDVELELAGLTNFQKSVIRQCRRIAAGDTATYGELASRAGHPHAARAVGQVMASNRFPLVVPCHRVVGAGGRLGGYSAPQGLELKKRLLADEGLAEFAHRPSRRTHAGAANRRPLGTCSRPCGARNDCLLG
jgi:methylated-DNA-[protein]-cysteine S-methyltransferase